jgi:hypothetical protein
LLASLEIILYPLESLVSAAIITNPLLPIAENQSNKLLNSPKTVPPLKS